MGTVVFVIVMTIIFLIIGIFLLQGKGSWLIAGYNTASPEEKAKYDKSKLCKVTAIICFVVAFLLCVMAYLGYKVETGKMAEDAMLPFALVFIAVVVGTVIISILYVNKNCKR